LAADKRAAKSLRASAKRKRGAATLPDFIAPQLCDSVERPPNGPGWAHEIKFDGYRLQLRTESGHVTLKTRKGLDWTAKFGAIAQAAANFPEGIIDGEVVALQLPWRARLRCASGRAV
jgi:bifunctional non-homologous end joining protein LigD